MALCFTEMNMSQGFLLLQCFSFGADKDRLAWPTRMGRAQDQAEPKKRLVENRSW